MDGRIRRGELIAGASAVVLLVVTVIFDWFGAMGPGEGEEIGFTAWEAFGLIDIVLLMTIGTAVIVAAMALGSESVNLPVAGSALVAGLGLLSVVLVVVRILSPPELGLSGVAGAAAVEVGREIGLFLGLAATVGIAYGGWTAMAEEGTGPGKQPAAADRSRSYNGGR